MRFFGAPRPGALTPPPGFTPVIPVAPPATPPVTPPATGGTFMASQTIPVVEGEITATDFQLRGEIFVPVAGTYAWGARVQVYTGTLTLALRAMSAPTTNVANTSTVLTAEVFGPNVALTRGSYGLFAAVDLPASLATIYSFILEAL